MVALTDLIDATDAANNQGQLNAYDQGQMRTKLGEDLTANNNQAAANGSYYSGGRSVRAGQIGEQESWREGDMNIPLANQMMELTKLRLLASYGFTGV